MIREMYDRHRQNYLPFYRKCESWFHADEKRVSLMNIFVKLSTVIMYAAYIISLIFLIVNNDMRIIRMIAVPAAVFVIVTVIRNAINGKRPYEYHDITPIVHKATKGKSCPSRHSGCAFGVAMAVFYIHHPAGIVLLVLSAMIAASRPLAGVHFPFDVIFGSALAIAVSIVGFYLFP